MYDVPLDHPRFGKLNRCPNHPVTEDTSHQERLRRVGNLDAFKEKTFENFVTNPPSRNYSENNSASLQMALTAAMNFARKPEGWLVLEGNYGCGKTHLAVAIGNTRVSQFGDQVLFITAPDLLDYLRTTYSPTAEIDYDESFNRIRNIQLLILDDLGVENPSGWAKEKLFQLLNYRYAKRLATVITTNVELDELDPRISSRMTEGEVVYHIKIDAPDYRPSVAKRNENIFSRLDLYANMTLGNFDVRSNDPHEQRNLEKIFNFAVSFIHRPERWLLIMGGYGSGKTHLAVAIAHELRNIGHQVMFTTVPDLMDYLRVTFDPKSNARFDKRFQEIQNIPILVLDDLSLESATAWSKEKLFQILDYRYVAQLPTILTSSKKLDAMDERLVTRLADARLCDMVAIEARSYVKRKFLKSEL